MSHGRKCAGGLLAHGALEDPEDLLHAAWQIVLNRFDGDVERVRALDLGATRALALMRCRNAQPRRSARPALIDREVSADARARVALRRFHRVDLGVEL